MPKDNSGLSDLESEFELEMEEDNKVYEGGSAPEDSEFELEMEGEDPNREYEWEAGFEPQGEYEAPEDKESYYANRFYEISEREYETEAEIDKEINGLLNEMERDFFNWKGLLKKAGKFAWKFAKATPYGQLIKGATQLARGDVKGLLGTFAKAGLGSVLSTIPGGAAALPFINKAIKSEVSEEDAKREFSQNFVAVSKEAFNYLANNFNERAAYDPVEASRLATRAFEAGVKAVEAPSRPSRGAYARPDVKVYKIKVRPGERIKILIKGA